MRSASPLVVFDDMISGNCSSAAERFTMINTLTELIAPVSPADFLETFRARRRLHIRASDPARAASLLPWQEIDTLLPMLARDDKLVVMRDGVAVPKEFYTSGERELFNSRAFHDLAAQGVSLVVHAIEELVPQIGRLTVAIERELGIPAQTNLYLSIAKGGAFKPHWDPHDVLVVQVHGTKRWRIWNAEARLKNAETASPAEKPYLMVSSSLPPDQEIEVGPGDVLFIPRGEPHSAAISAEHSVHLTVGLKSLTGLDFVNYLRKEANTDLVLRMNLPRHASEAEVLKHEADVKHRLHRLIDATTIAQFLRQDDLNRRPYVQTAVSGALPRTDDVLRLTLRRRIPLPDGSPDGASQPVTIGGEACRLAPESIGLLRWLFDNDPATRRELDDALSPHYGQAAINAALRELSRFGFLVVVAQAD